MTRVALVKNAFKALGRPVANGLEKGAASNPSLRRLVDTIGQANHRFTTRVHNVDTKKITSKAAAVLFHTFSTLAFVPLFWSPGAGYSKIEEETQQLDMDIQAKDRQRQIREFEAMNRSLLEQSRQLRELSRQTELCRDFLEAAVTGQKP